MVTDKDRALWGSLDDAFAGLGYGADVLVWRGFRKWNHPGRPPHGWTPPTIGSVERSDAWMSTSLREQVAGDEAHVHAAQHGDYSVVYEIVVPQGHPAIYAEAVRDEPSHEAELLLPRGTRYEVTNFEQFSALRSEPDDRRGPFYGFRLSATVLLPFEPLPLP